MRSQVGEERSGRISCGRRDVTAVATPETRSRWWRGAFGFTLMAAMGVATFIGFVIGVLAPLLVDDLAMSRTQLGSLSTVLYLVGGFGSPIAGHLADRMGGRTVLIAVFAAGAAATIAVALAPSYAWLLAAMTVAGLALAAANPVTNKLVAAHIRPGAQGVLMGVKQAGVPMSKFLAGAVMPAAALWLGWRNAVLLGLLIPIAGLVVGHVLLPDDLCNVTTRAERRNRPLSAAVRRLSIYGFLMGTGIAVTNVYLPLYAHDELGMSVPAAGAVASLTGIVGVGSRIAWGRRTDGTAEVGPTLGVIAAGSAVAIALLIAARWWGTWLVWAASFLIGAITVGWIVVGMVGVVAITDPRDAGRASGRVLLGFYTGFVCSPVAFGWIVDATSVYAPAWALVALAFVGAILVSPWWGAGGRSSPKAASALATGASAT